MSKPSEQSFPNEVRKILCLANSRKPNGRCIAGREVVNGLPGPWIRPVSARSDHAVSEYERQYQDGSDPKVLDVIEVPLIRSVPNSYQHENWLLDPGFYWVKTKKFSWSKLQSFVEPCAPLWINGYKTYHGCHDRVPFEKAKTLQTSLRLIRLDQLMIKVYSPGAKFGDHKRKIQGEFRCAGVLYRLRITDPVYERRYLARPDGTYEIGECCVTISLGEPHTDGFTYKLIAAVIERV